MIKVFENIVPKQMQDEIDGTINNDMFPWYFMDSIRTQREYPQQYLKDIPKWDTDKVVDSFGLIHLVYSKSGVNSPIFDLFRKVLAHVEKAENFEVNDILRIRIRRTMRTPDTNETTYNTPHVDLIHDKPFWTFVYYIEESDGQTIFFDQTYAKGSNASLKESPKIIQTVPHSKGNGVLFDGFRFHAGNSPIKYVKRTVINFDFTTKELV